MHPFALQLNLKTKKLLTTNGARIGFQFIGVFFKPFLVPDVFTNNLSPIIV
ncbi:protein of unknown function [Pseudodesulfovibrio profundus]|uniref:Uncharacterized protein n=1 Tax=Pseudodesulfovibrio profundus TaxID=57320 RepID=A0A2C8F382_9BACT|nr:protein of unknown function [Pseudodesulfovibrio profundus]